MTEESFDSTVDNLEKDFSISQSKSSHNLTIKKIILTDRSGLTRTQALKCILNFEGIIKNIQKILLKHAQFKIAEVYFVFSKGIFGGH